MIIRILHHCYYIYIQLKENGYSFSDLIINPVIVIAFGVCNSFIHMSNNYFTPLEIHSNILYHIIIGGLLGISMLIVIMIFERQFVMDLYKLLTNKQI